MAADANHIKYSQILKNALDGSGQPDDRSEVKDTWEYHAGLEYVIKLSSTPVALRAGYFYRPNHSVSQDGKEFNGTDDQIYACGLVRS